MGFDFFFGVVGRYGGGGTLESGNEDFGWGGLKKISKVGRLWRAGLLNF